jgi:hypothetical protein
LLTGDGPESLERWPGPSCVAVNAMYRSAMRRWEYLILSQTRDAELNWKVKSKVFGPDDLDWRQHPSESALEILQELGAEGWELVSVPLVHMAVTSISDKSPRGWTDAASWYTRDFYLKRQVDE